MTWFAAIALLAWPVVALWLYSSRPVAQATVWTFLGAFLLLPVGAASIKFVEGVPQLDKVSIPALAALAGCFFIARRPLRFRNGFGLAEILLLMFFIGPVVTSELNNDPVMSGPHLSPGVGTYDALSAIFAQFLFVLPFFLGRQFLNNSHDIEETLRSLVVAGLLYSLPMLFEIRISPQLHYWLYGFYPFGFATQMRYGGFRPTVFMENGLVAAFFVMTATMAAAAFWRTRTLVHKRSAGAITAYLGALLILCKSLGGLLYSVFLIPLVCFAKPQLQLRIAMILVIFALAYPLVRATNLWPTTHLVSAARSINDDRADSLEFRFDNEQQLLNRASQRILFGWGRFGRNRVYDEWGTDIGITDGRWIVTIGVYGVFGFLAEFGLLALPVFCAASALRFSETERDSIFLGTLALIIAINLIDLLPNGSLSPWTWLLAGALLGRAEALRDAARGLRRVDRVAGASENGEQAAFQGTAFRNPFRRPKATKKDDICYAKGPENRSGR